MNHQEGHTLILYRRTSIYIKLHSVCLCVITFLIKESTNEIFETYFINKKRIKQKLGSVSSNTTNTFIWKNNIQTSFIKRRSNFHGLKLKGMVEFSGYSMNANLSYIGKRFLR